MSQDQVIHIFESIFQSGHIISRPQQFAAARCNTLTFYGNVTTATASPRNAIVSLVNCTELIDRFPVVWSTTSIRAFWAPGTCTSLAPSHLLTSKSFRTPLSVRNPYFPHPFHHPPSVPFLLLCRAPRYRCRHAPFRQLVCDGGLDCLCGGNIRIGSRTVALHTLCKPAPIQR